MSAEVFYRAMGLSGYWVVDVWESRGGVIEVLVEPAGPRGYPVVAVSSLSQSSSACSRTQAAELEGHTVRRKAGPDPDALSACPLSELWREDVASAEVRLRTEAVHQEL